MTGIRPSSLALALLFAFLVFRDTGLAQEKPISLENRWAGFALKQGVPQRLYDAKTQETLANLPYRYAFQVADKPWQEFQPTYLYHRIKRKAAGTYAWTGVRAGPAEIHHEFFLPHNRPYLEEQLTLINRGDEGITAHDLGFRRSSHKSLVFAAIPFGHPMRRKNIGYPPYGSESLLNHAELVGTNQPATFGSEAWALETSSRTWLVSKRNTDEIEYSVLRLSPASRESRLSFGGSARWLGYPESHLALSPGRKVRSGWSRYQVVDGRWKDAFSAYRLLMHEAGYRPPKDYDPPILWNELFDNPAGLGETPEKRALYKLDVLVKEAAKAVSMQAQGLYLDPGWDTLSGSSVWDEKRLGAIKTFVQRMKKRYGLAVGLHTPMPSMVDPAAYPSSTWSCSANCLPLICTGSEAYLAEQARRLKVLAAAGIRFMMFDGTCFTGACTIPSHGHAIPYTKAAHAGSVLRLLQAVRSVYPEVLIELHDPVIAGQRERLVPMYFLYDRPYSFTEIWASEFMWSPLQDLLNGHSRALYYYNLAYDLPLYLHIDLRDDSPGALSLWWYASTCRHLGIGGTSSNPEVLRAQREAMQLYRRWQAFFKRGRFFGLGEDAHVHTLAQHGEAVLLLFNARRTPWPIHKEFSPEDIGLPANAALDAQAWKGLIRVKRSGSRLRVESLLAPESVVLVHLKVS